MFYVWLKSGSDMRILKLLGKYMEVGKKIRVWKDVNY